MEQDIIELIIKKYNKGLNPEEEALLQQWCKMSGKNNEFYRMSNQLFDSPSDATQDTGKPWATLQSLLKEDKQKRLKRKKIYYLCGSIAASLLLLLGISFTFLYREGNTPENFREIRTAYGESRAIVLPDSSTVWLAGGTTIQYPLDFKGTKRQIQLAGEAFFDVRKGLGEFSVITGKTSILVKGTRFNVKAYQEDNRIETTLVEGKVSFTCEDREITLQPEEKVTYNKSTGTIEKKQVTYMNCCIDNEIRFEDERLEEVMLYLKRYYNANTNFKNEELKNLHYSGVIRKNNSLPHTLEVITTALNIQGELTGNVITLNKPGS